MEAVCDTCPFMLLKHASFGGSMRPLLFILSFTAIHTFYSPNVNAESCLHVFAGTDQAVLEQVEKIKYVKRWNVERTEIKKIEGTTEEILNALEGKRLLQPHPGSTLVWYQDYFSQALLVDFGKRGLSRESPMEVQAARLIWGSPDLMSLMILEAMSHDNKANMKTFYKNFITNVVQNMLGNSSALRERLWEEMKLSLYKFKPKSNDSHLAELDKILERQGIRGFVQKSEKSNMVYVAMNPTFEYDAIELLNAEKVGFDEIDEEGLSTLASAQKVHILAHTSDRWHYRTFARDFKFLNTLYGHAEQEPRGFAIEFYSEDVAQTWVPPAGVRISSRVGNVITVVVTGASRILALDSDIRIRAFEY